MFRAGADAVVGDSDAVVGDSDVVGCDDEGDGGVHFRW